MTRMPANYIKAIIAPEGGCCGEAGFPTLEKLSRMKGEMHGRAYNLENNTNDPIGAWN